MKRVTPLLIAVVTFAGVAAFTELALHADGETAPVFVTKIPPGYREWRLMSVAHVEVFSSTFG
jgi:hypothetical protein